MFHLTTAFDADLLPQALKERYRIAEEAAIKVALYLLCAGKGDEETIADALSMPVVKVRRALEFWQSVGLISTEPSKLAVKATPEKAKPEPARTPLSPARISEISLRNPEIVVLLQETQNFLGRTLDSNESRMLLEIFEYDELPVDVILMILAYCAPRAKSKRAVIGLVARTAGDWREIGIDSASAAEAHIRLLEQRESLERGVAAALGLESADFTRPQRGYIVRWFEEYGYDIDFVKEAYLRTGNSSVSYINGVLKNWHQNGFKTLRDTMAAPSNAPVPVKKKKNSSDDSLLMRALEKRRKARVGDGVQ